MATATDVRIATPTRAREPAILEPSTQPAARGRPPTAERRRRLARGLISLLVDALPEDAGLELALDEGAAGVPVTAPSSTRARAIIRGPDSLARLLWPPTPDAFAEGYLRGDVEIQGDIGAAIVAAESMNLRRLGLLEWRRIGRWGGELRRGTPAGRPLARVARLIGRRHSRARDLAAIRFHYDVGNAFYALWLDRRLTYSCAYFGGDADPTNPAGSLDAAQEAKLDLICRKLDLQAGDRLLDIGCGWGSLLGYAGERYGVQAVGATLSEKQASYANERAAGTRFPASAHVLDYRDLAGLGTFDAIASIGMFEHVGRSNLGAYFDAAHRAVRPGGRFLNHGIAQARARSPLAPDLRPRASRFVERYVFPDGELVPVEAAIRAAREAGFEVLDLQSLRAHYALTLAAWVSRLEASWDAAVGVAGEEVARTWRLYMSAAKLGFERGELDVFQLLLARPATDGPAPRPLRPWWRA